MQVHHSEQDIRILLESLNDILRDEYLSPDAKPVFDYKEPERIAALFDEPSPPKEGMGLELAMKTFQNEVLPSSVKTWHPMFMNQMSAGASLPAVVGDTLSSMLNCTLSTFEAAPAATVIERVVCRWMAGLLGMKDGSGGIFLPGSSLGNLLGLAAARNSKLGDDFRRTGFQGLDKKPIIFCSEASHYSVTGAASLLGFGSDQVFKLATNERNEILPASLAQALDQCDQQGLDPFVISVTIGSTVTGGVDPLPEIVELCKGRDIHIHVDAAFGGGYALTREGAKVFQHIGHADTITWDAHKWMHSPLTCTVLLSPDPSILKKSFKSGAGYLFHQENQEDQLTEDLGNYTILCGKRFQGLGLWLMFKAFGENFFRKHAEDRLAFVHEFKDALKRDPDFSLAYDPVLPVLCFRYLPDEARDWSPEAINRLQRRIRQQVREHNVALFNITDIKGKDFFRLILINPLTTMKEIKPMLEAVREIGDKLMHESLAEPLSAC